MVIALSDSLPKNKTISVYEGYFPDTTLRNNGPQKLYGGIFADQPSHIQMGRS